MSVATFNPQNPTNLDTQSPKSTGCGGGTYGCAGGDKQTHEHHHHEHTHNHDHHDEFDDDIRIMPTSDDLKRPHSEKELIEEALAEAKRPDNLNCSSKPCMPTPHWANPLGKPMKKPPSAT